jgi:hypothetical protein
MRGRCPLPLSPPARLSRVIGIFIANHQFLHSANRSRALRRRRMAACPPVRAALAQHWRISKLHTARAPGGRAGLSSGLVVVELERNARPRVPRRSGCDATRRQAGHVRNGNSVRMCVASYTTVTPDAEPDGGQPTFGMTASFDRLLNLHLVREWSCYQKINIDSAGNATASPARRAFGD